MIENLKIKDLMTTKLVVITPNTYMHEVEKIFATHSFHHLPVVNKKKKLVGLISKHDFNVLLNSQSIFCSERARSANEKFLRSLIVEEVMTEVLAKLHPENPISLAVGIFRENLFHIIPIVNEAEELVGMLSPYDLINYAYQDKYLLPAVE